MLDYLIPVTTITVILFMYYISVGWEYEEKIKIKKKN
jgi:hypothetical protein